MKLLHGNKEYKSDSCLPVFYNDIFSDNNDNSPRLTVSSNRNRSGASYMIQGGNGTSGSKGKHVRNLSTQPQIGVEKAKVFPFNPLMGKQKFISTKKVINIPNQKSGGVLKIPALDIVQLGHKNRMFNYYARGGNAGIQVNQDSQNFADIIGVSHPGFVLDDLQSPSSSSDYAKAKVKDIVLDPRSRKRLLDSLHIVTTREKRRNLEMSV